MATTTWNPSDKNAAIALSNGNRTATSSAGSGTVNAAVRATTAISATTKQYFEVTVSAYGGTLAQYFSIGVMNSAASLSANMGATNGAALVSWLSAGSTRTYINGTISTTTYPNFYPGVVIRVAVDRAANKIWWAANNDIWSGSSVWIGSGATGDDPATGTGGASISAVTGTIYPALSSAWTGDVAVINGGTTAFAYAIPSGFAGLDGTSARATLVASEQWIMPNADARATQVLLEMWAPGGTTTPRAVATLVALEMWGDTGLAVTQQQARAWIMA